MTGGFAFPSMDCILQSGLKMIKIPFGTAKGFSF